MEINIGYIVIIMAILFFIIGWATLCLLKYRKWSQKANNCTKELKVAVIDILERKTARGGMIYKPIFQSLDYSIIIDSAYYSSLVSFQQGEQVYLLINPNNPKEFLYKDNAYNKGKIADIVCCLLPLIFILGIGLSLIK